MKILTSFLLLFLLPACSYSKEVSRTSVRVDGQFLFLKGIFDQNTNQLVKDTLVANPAITTLVFTDNGGSINDEATLELGRYIRKKGLNTHIATGGSIASGGLSLFLSGIKRSKGQNIQIGVHSWQHCQGQGDEQVCKDAQDHAKDDPGHDLHKDYVEEMLGKTEFYWFSIYAAVSSDIYWLTEGDMNQYALINHKLSQPAEVK